MSDLSPDDLDPTPASVRRTGWLRRHKALAALGTILVVLLSAFGIAALYLNAQLGNIPRIDAGIDAATGPGAGESDTGRPLNILLAGTDSRRPDELAALVRDGWRPGAMRSDTIIILHLSADRRKADVVSIPRDSWVNVPGQGNQKINAAFSLGGPELYVDTIEDFTGLRIDHLAVVDWEGFKGLTKAVGGVDVQIAQTVTDPRTGKTWKQGPAHLEGVDALDYVRQRYGLPNGDFDRINRQQNFLRAILTKLTARGTMTNPRTLASVTRELGAQLTLDDTLDNRAVRELAWSLRGLESKDITFLTVPIKGYDRIDGQSVVLVDRPEARRLFGAMMSDDLAAYVKERGTPQLPGPAAVR